MSLTITARGRATLAKLIKAGDLWLVVGKGGSGWPVPVPPAVDDAAIGLVDPVALVRLAAADFVQPVTDAEAFVTDDGQKWAYAAAGVSTAHLCLDFRLGPADLNDVDAASGLREWQLTVNPVFASAIPGGQRIVPMASVTSIGDPLAIEHSVPSYRTGVDEVRRYVITP